MPSWKTVYEKERLSGEDLVIFGPGDTKRILRPQVQVARVIVKEMRQAEKMGGGKKKKLLCYFAGKKKYIILNDTNCKSLQTLSGTDDYEGWAGVKCTLTTYEKEIFKEMRWVIDLQKPDEPKAKAATDTKTDEAVVEEPAEPDPHPEDVGDVADVSTEDGDDDYSELEDVE